MHNTKLIRWEIPPFFLKQNTVGGIWLLSGTLYALVKIFMGKYNNYKIFANSFDHIFTGQPLYVEYPSQYYNIYIYGPLFPFIVYPFSLLPYSLGMILWILANTTFLFYAIQKLPLTSEQKIFIGWYALCELATAQGVQQFNISIAAIIILTFVSIEKDRNFLAAFLIASGTLIKIYPIIGLIFLFYSKHKKNLILSCIFWFCLLFIFPILYCPGINYLLSQYSAWLQTLHIKYTLNMFAISQNISLLGMIRKISGCATYNDLLIIIPGIVLLIAPYVRINQYKFLNFRLMSLANLLLFTVLFSSGTESSGYILAMIGVALWYICSPTKQITYKRWLTITTLIIVGLSTTEIVPSVIRKEFIWPYVLKAWPCVIIWLTICYEMIRCDFSPRPSLTSNQSLNI